MIKPKPHKASILVLILGSLLGVQINAQNIPKIVQIQLKTTIVNLVKLDISGWPKGHYFAKIVSDNPSQILKITAEEND